MSWKHLEIFSGVFNIKRRLDETIFQANAIQNPLLIHSEPWKFPKKSPVAYVSDRRDSTKRRMTFPFISADRYDPKQVSTYLGYVLKPPKKYFLAIQIRTLDGLS